MSEGPRLVTIGSINAGATAIQVDVRTLGSDVPASVTLTTNFTLANPMPPGFPIEPGQTGVAISTFYAPGAVIPSGTVLSVFQAVRTALVAAGAGT